MVRAFIEGYQCGARKNERRHEWREVFTYWVNSHYGNPGPTSANGFTLIKLKVGGDDELAFDEFYRLLPLYEKDIREIGLDGIMKRWRKKYEAYIEEWKARQSA
jgi:hypothetical protein